MSEQKPTYLAVAAVVAVFSIGIGGFTLYDAYTNSTPVVVEVIEPPNIPKVIELNDCLVEVSAHTPEQRHYGNGVLMQKNGQTFVLTSEMIFVNEFESIQVKYQNGLIDYAELIATDSLYGLAILDVGDHMSGFEVDVAPNLPPDAETEVFTLQGNAHAKVKEYINADWMLLSGLNNTFVGAPLVNGGQVSGIVVGVNRNNAKETIAVGNRAIYSLTDEVIHADAPVPYLPHRNPYSIPNRNSFPFPYNPNSMHDVLQPPEKPYNILRDRL